MCLICLAYQVVPGYQLVLIANRDEFLARPTEPLSWRGTSGRILAGLDLEGGGTWLGLSTTGRLAALTNYRDPRRLRANAPSRGRIVMDYLQSHDCADSYWAKLAADKYNSFNLLTYDGRQLQYYSNRTSETSRLTPGIYGLSNHLLDTPWPKVSRIKQLFADVMVDSSENFREKLLTILTDDQIPPDHSLPDTGVGYAWEKILSPIFISSPTYGTRSSAVITIDRQGLATFVERTYGGLPAVRDRVTRTCSCAGFLPYDSSEDDKA